MVNKMTEHNFAFIVSGVDANSDDFEDRFFEAGCSDATLMLTRGLVAVCFAREAEDYIHGVISAYEDVLKTGAHINRFEPDFLVSQIEIAKRAKLSRAAINLYVSGERGNNFPSPRARITSSSPLWDWVDVSAWLHHHDVLPVEDVIHARISRVINMTVQGVQRDSDKNLVHLMRDVAQEPIFALS